MAVGLSDGTSFQDSTEWLSTAASMKHQADQAEIKANTTSGDFQSRFYATDASTMPPQASRELAGALKQSGGSLVASRGYNTQLSPEEEAKFPDWKAKYAPNDTGQDYDLRGAFRADVTPDPERGHLPDTFKKPNHPTFSDQSMYHGVNGNVGGTWGNDNNKDFFVPSTTNLENMHPDQLKDYFKRVEPDAELRSNPDILGTLPVPGNKNMNITMGDVDKAIDIGMATGPGSIKGIGGPYKNYIDMFLKQPVSSSESAIIKPMPKNPWEGSGHLDDSQFKQTPFLDWNQVGAGKFEVFNPIDGKTVSTHPTKELAQQAAAGFEQQPLINTWQAAADSTLSKNQLHPDNFYKIDMEALSDKQAKDLHNTFSDFKQGAISKAEYLDEMHEYEKFSQAKHIPITESGKTVDQSPALTHGKKVLHDIIDDYPELLDSPKASPKEKFIDALDNIHNRLSTTFANIRDKYVNTVKGDRLEVNAPVSPEAIAKGYTEPAYRGLKVYPDKQTNPVFNFGESEESKMYSTASPMLADMYSEYLSHHPGYKVPEGTFKEGAQVMPLYINTKDYHYYDAKGGHWSNENPKAIQQALDAKKKGVVVDNVRDEPNSTTKLPPKKIFITFPSGAGTVKSRFAKNFDPSSPNILHGIGSAAAIGTAAGYLTDEADRE
jgi:hypothetical protein